MGSQLSPNPNPWSSSATLVTQNGDYNATFFKNLGFITNQSDFVFTNRSGGVFDNDQELKNYGSFENNDGATLNNWGNIYTFANLFNAAGGVYNNNSAGILDNSGFVQNNGTMNINSGEMYNAQGAALLNKGALLIKHGKLYNGVLCECDPSQKNGTLINNGSIQIFERGSLVNEKNGLIKGTGTIQGDVSNFGVINAGTSAGGHLIDGTLYHQQSGIIRIELGGSSDANRDRSKTEYDFIDVTEDLVINGGRLGVSLIDNFELRQNQEFIITKLGGELTGHYDGLKQGDSVGRFESVHGFKLDLHISYVAGDGNDISLYTVPLTNPDMIFGYT